MSSVVERLGIQVFNIDDMEESRPNQGGVGFFNVIDGMEYRGDEGLPFREIILGAGEDTVESYGPVEIVHDPQHISAILSVALEIAEENGVDLPEVYGVDSDGEVIEAIVGDYIATTQVMLLGETFATVEYKDVGQERLLKERRWKEHQLLPGLFLESLELSPEIHENIDRWAEIKRIKDDERQLVQKLAQEVLGADDVGREQRVRSMAEIDWTAEERDFIAAWDEFEEGDLNDIRILAKAMAKALGIDKLDMTIEEQDGGARYVADRLITRVEGEDHIDNWIFIEGRHKYREPEAGGWYAETVLTEEQDKILNRLMSISFSRY